MVYAVVVSGVADVVDQLGLHIAVFAPSDREVPATELRTEEPQEEIPATQEVPAIWGLSIDTSEDISCPTLCAGSMSCLFEDERIDDESLDSNNDAPGVEGLNSSGGALQPELFTAMGTAGPQLVAASAQKGLGDISSVTDADAEARGATAVPSHAVDWRCADFNQQPAAPVTSMCLGPPDEWLDLLNCSGESEEQVSRSSGPSGTPSLELTPTQTWGSGTGWGSRRDAHIWPTHPSSPQAQNRWFGFGRLSELGQQSDSPAGPEVQASATMDAPAAAWPKTSGSLEQGPASLSQDAPEECIVKCGGCRVCTNGVYQKPPPCCGDKRCARDVEIHDGIQCIGKVLKMSVSELKLVCEANNWSKSGRKDDLMSRVLMVWHGTDTFDLKRDPWKSSNDPFSEVLFTTPSRKKQRVSESPASTSSRSRSTSSQSSEAKALAKLPVRVPVRSCSLFPGTLFDSSSERLRRSLAETQ